MIPIFCIFLQLLFPLFSQSVCHLGLYIRDIELANGKVSVILWSYVASWLYFLMMYIGFLIVFRSSLSNHPVYLLHLELKTSSIVIPPKKWHCPLHCLPLVRSPLGTENSTEEAFHCCASIEFIFQYKQKKGLCT